MWKLSRSVALGIMVLCGPARPLVAQHPAGSDTGLSDDHFLPVSGRVTDGERKLEGCEIITYLGNERIHSFTTDRSGRFEVGVGLNAQYGIEFRKPGFVPKRIIVDTRSDLAPEELLFIPLDMDVSMLAAEKYEGADTDALDFPFAIVRFDKKTHAFVQDRAYTTDMMRTNGALLLMAGRARQ